MALIVLRKIVPGGYRAGSKSANLTAQHGMVWRIRGLIRACRRLFDTRNLSPYIPSSPACFEQGSPIREGMPRKEAAGLIRRDGCRPGPRKGAVCPAAVFASDGRPRVTVPIFRRVRSSLAL